MASANCAGYFEGYNAQWMAQASCGIELTRHKAMTAIGQIGRLKLSPRIVIRLEPKDEGRRAGYLREASYRSYHSHRQAWYSGEARSDFADIHA